jgi:hypothetical protein
MVRIDRQKDKARTLALRNTTNSKKYTARNSAASQLAAPLISEEIMKRQVKPRRSSVTQSTLQYFEEIDIDEIHVEGNNDMIDKMKEYVNREYMKRSKGIGR